MVQQVNVLLGCETSGALRRRFAAQGHNAVSIDLLPADDGATWLGGPPGIGRHWQGDLFDALDVLLGDEGWTFDLAILHPECTYLTSSGLHWNGRVPGRQEKTEAALAFVSRIWALPFACLAIENPQGCISTRLPFMPKPQYVQPYQFGDDASKKTGLWTRGLPPLVIDPAKRCPGRWVEWNGKRVERWSNQTDSGQNKLAPSADRWKVRSETYPGIADAIVNQWGLAS